MRFKRRSKQVETNCEGCLQISNVCRKSFLTVVPAVQLRRCISNGGVTFGRRCLDRRVNDASRKNQNNKIRGTVTNARRQKRHKTRW